MKKIIKLYHRLYSLGLHNPKLHKLAFDNEAKFADKLNYQNVSQILGFGLNPTKDQHLIILDNIKNDNHTLFSKEQLKQIKEFNFNKFKMNDFKYEKSLSKEEKSFIAIVSVFDLMTDSIRDYIVGSDLSAGFLFKRMKEKGWHNNNWLDFDFYNNGIKALDFLQKEWHQDFEKIIDKPTDVFLTRNVVYSNNGYDIVYVPGIEDGIEQYKNIPNTSNDRVVLGNKLGICLGQKKKLYQDNSQGKIYAIFKNDKVLAALRISDKLEEGREKLNKNLSLDLAKITLDFMEYMGIYNVSEYSGINLVILAYEDIGIDISKFINDDDENLILKEIKKYPDFIRKTKDKNIYLENNNGDKYWYLNGRLHREGGPAVEGSNGNKEYYINGQRHREDGPACEYANGNKIWYIKGQRHRINGPACEYANGDKHWYINDQRHRIDGPAIENNSGYKAWYLNGKKHRINGPAIEYANGNKYWYVNDQPHRVDGPAIEFADGNKLWYLFGKEYSEQDYYNKLKELRNEKNN